MANLLATCATKLTVAGTAAPPENLMVCGNARFVGSSGNHIYMGTSHGSVDIDFNRSASQDLLIRTYSGGWNTALRILGTGVFACSCLQSPTLCATTCVKAHSLRQTTNQQYLCLYTGCDNNQPGGIKFMSCGGTTRGYVYFDGSSNFGLLNCGGQWAIRIVGTQSSNSCMYTCHPLEAATSFSSPIVCGTTCVKTSTVCGTACVVGNRFKSNVRLWDTVAPSGNNFFAESGASGGDAFALGQGTGILDIWVKDDSVNELRSVFRANNQGSCIVIGRGCSSNDNANIPVYVCNCLQSPILCATSCTNYGACATSKLTSDGDNMRHTTQYGYMQFGPGNASYAHFNTDRPQFYFNKKLVVNAGQVESYDEDLILQRTSSGTNRIKITTDTTHICQYTNIAGKLAVNVSGLTCCCALNCGKADFEVNTCGGVATAAWSGGRFRVGSDDINWSTRILQSGYFETYSSNLHVRVHTGNHCVILCPHGTGFTKACGTLCVTGPTNLGSLLTVNTLCATTGMSRSFPTWSTVGTRYLPQVNASANLPVGWYTIFVNTGNRAGGRFILRDTTGSRHQYVVFYASHSYGNGNSINVLQYSRFSGQPIQCVRVKDFSTYDGAALQVYVCDATNNLVAYEAGDNVHSSGWYFLNSWCCDACVPYSTSCFNACWPAGCYCDGASVNLHCIQDGGQILTGKLYVPVLCATSVVKSGDWVCGSRMCSTACILTPTCVHGDVLCASSTASISGDTDYEGLAVGQAYSNEGNWNTQLNTYGRYHNILRIKKCAGSITDNAQCLSLWVHDNHAATIQSTGNLLLKAGSAMSMCLKNGLACTPILCATTCTKASVVCATANEGINFKGARGCFTNEFMHLYNKVGIGHPGGWGCGEGNTPSKGLSTYGKACIGYGITQADNNLIVAGGVETTGSHGITSGTHGIKFYPDTNNMWNIKSATTTSSLRFRDCDNNIDGYVYADNGHIGFLDQASHWAYYHKNDTCHAWRINNAQQMTLYSGCLCHCAKIEAAILCGPTCVSSNSLVISPTVCATSCVKGDVIETSGSIVRWCYPSNCGPFLQTGGSYSAPTLALKRHDGDLNNTELLTGKFCGSVCVRSPIVCATSCFKSDNCFHFTQNTPYICTGGAYVIIPGGIYANSGTIYAESTIMTRNGICDDTASTLDIWGGTGSNINLRGNTYACACLYVYCTLCMAPDSYTDMANGIVLGKVGGLPQAAWGESGSKTGRIEIGLPTLDGQGGSTHHGMVHVAIDVYEYNSNDATTIIVGGHNWNCRWYNCGAHMTGGCTDKTIKLAYHSCGGTSNGRYVILLGECDSSWSYGSVHVRSITNGLYYCNNMNMGTPWYVKRVTCPDSHYNLTTADLRSSSNSMAGYQCAMVCLHTPRVCATTCVKSACICASSNMLFEGTLYAVGGGGGHWDTNRLCAATCVATPLVRSPIVFPTSCLMFDENGVRSWKVCASSGNLNFHSGDGSGSFYFHSQLYSSYLHSTGMVWGSTCICSPRLCATSEIKGPIVCGTSCIQTHYYRSGANNMCLCPSGCGYGIFFGPGNIGEKQHWTTSVFTASGTQARRAKLLEFSYNTHHWDSGGPIFIDIYHNYFGKGSHQRWQVIQTGLDGSGSQNCSAGADLPAGARDVRLMLLESNGDDTVYFKLHVDMHAAGYKISDYDVGIAEVYLDVDYYAQVAAKVTLHGTWNNINTGSSFNSNNSSQYKFYNDPVSYTNISSFHNSPPTVPGVAGRSLYAERIYGHSSWQACCQNCYANICGRYLCLRGTSCMAELKTSGTICGSGLICANSCLHSPVMCFSSCLCATGGCIKVPVVEARYSNANTNYRGGMCWSHLQLGNNGSNRIIAGTTGAGGYLDIYTNNTANVLGGTNTNGCHVARFNCNGYTIFYDWIQVAASKGIYGATNNGHFYLNATSTYGAWALSGARNDYNGIYMCGMTVMAHCDCSLGGLFNDVDDEWMVRGSRNAGVQLYFDGAAKLETYANGITVCAHSHSTCIYPSASWSHFYTTASKYFFDHEVHINSGVISSYDEPLKLATCGTVRAQLCETCFCTSTRICAAGGFYGDGSNLTGISAGIDGCSFQGAVGNPSGCSYERTTNVRLGTCAMPTGKGVHSTAIGNNALQYQNCSWYYGHRSANTAVGADSQQCSMGFQNTSVGWMALRGAANNCKCYNVGIGACTGYLGILGNYSVAIGTGTDRYMSDCSVAVGAQADAGNEAVMVGFSSGANDGTFKGDVAMGYRSLYSSGCGCYRIAIGHCAGYAQGQWNHKEKYTIAIGACALACGSHYHDCFNYNIVIGNPHNSCAAGQCLGSCTTGCMILGDGNINNACICASCLTVSYLSKSSGSFRINHPNPSCSSNRALYHSFVESPNEGDNIYRWQVETSDCTSVITLPNYYRYLNKNDMVWVSPYRHFGSAYGEVTADQCCLVICSNSDGCFNVLLVGTRKDEAATENWKGAERDEEPIYHRYG